MRGARIRTLALALAGVSAMGLAMPFATAAHAQDANRRNFNIPAQDMASALESFGRQSGRDILFDRGQVAGQRSNTVRGSLEPGDALRRLIGSSGLSVTAPNATTFVVGRGTGEGQAGSAAAESASAEQAEIVVTGTNIRGGTVASPTESFSREDIQRSGVVSFSDFVRQIPQNSGSGASEITVGGLAGTSNSNAGGINLRSLGNDSTLLLVNGHRVAPSGLDGSFVDLGMIPTSAIERVDLVFDGASSIYGSDAVGGVVNVRLRSNFEGAESRLRYTNYSNSDSYELNASQTIGARWSSGSVLLGYDYYKRTPIDADERRAFTTVAMPYTITSQNRRHSVIVAAHQDLGGGASLAFDGFYANRATVSDSTSSGTIARGRGETENWNAALELTVPISDDVTFTGTGAYGNSDGTSQTVRGGVAQPRIDASSGFYSLEGKIDASLFELPAGPVRLAAGVHYRHESFDQNFGSVLRMFATSRRNLAGFAELNAPLLSARDPGGPPLLQATVAGRIEDISAVGTTFNPRLGLVLNPVSSLRLRGTYGRSFKAPRLNDLNPNPSSIVTWALVQPPAAPANGLILFGGNPDLNPERAQTFTAGFDWNQGASGFRASSSFYHIRYRNRVSDLSNFVIFTDILRVENLLQGTGIIQRNPSQAFVQELYASPYFTNVFQFPANSISVFVDYRPSNIALTTTSGIDFDVGYSAPVGRGNIDLSLSGNYIFFLKNRIVPGTPSTDVVGTTFNPPAFRAVGRVGYTSDRFDIFATGRYIDSYTNNKVTPNVPVSSWLTFDLSAAIRLSTGQSHHNDVEISIGANNIFNRNPPFVQLPFGLTYDGTNANPYRRSVYVAVTKRW